MIFQEYGVFPWLTVRGEHRVRLEARARTASARPSARTICDRYMGLMGLADSPTPGRRCCRAACGSASRSRARTRCSPEFLLMDEPFGALDAQTRNAMQDLLLQVLAPRGRR